MQTRYRYARKRGKYTKKIIDDYCVIDLETTGLSWFDDTIIEVGILKIRNQQIIDKYSQLVNPKRQVSPFITRLTGITNDMLLGMPTLDEIKDDVFNFIGDDILLGHNTSFDLNFVANQFNIDIENEYMDTLQFCRKIYPYMKHHRLTDMVQYLNLSNNEHRSIADCIATYELYEKIKIEIKDKKIIL